MTNGDAGGVVETFGTFVTGGNIVVGLVVFAILVIIQFLVITKGAERVSEVAARFTLDAMPGKQMSIDADLNAGMISETEARMRREKVSNEADFYGAMDGATKFVKGDAIASIIIVIINLLVGMIIGVAQMGLPFGEAAVLFSQLTVGDGIVSQIPALLISTATGLWSHARHLKGIWVLILLISCLDNRNCFTWGCYNFILGLATPINDMLTIPIAAALAAGAFIDVAQSSGRSEGIARDRRGC